MKNNVNSLLQQSFFEASENIANEIEIKEIESEKESFFSIDEDYYSQAELTEITKELFWGLANNEIHKEETKDSLVNWFARVSAGKEIAYCENVSVIDLLEIAAVNGIRIIN